MAAAAGEGFASEQPISGQNRPLVLHRDMRRSFVLRVAFSPTRLSADHLREAYEAVTTVMERPVKQESEPKYVQLTRARRRQAR